MCTYADASCQLLLGTRVSATGDIAGDGNDTSVTTPGDTTIGDPLTASSNSTNATMPDGMPDGSAAGDIVGTDATTNGIREGTATNGTAANDSLTIPTDVTSTTTTRTIPPPALADRISTAPEDFDLPKLLCVRDLLERRAPGYLSISEIEAACSRD